MKNNKMLKLIRQSGDAVFVNMDRVNFVTTKHEMGSSVTEVGFMDKQSLTVTESIEDLEKLLVSVGLWTSDTQRRHNPTTMVI